MVCLGFEPRAAGEVGWKVHTITLSYGGSTFMLSLIRVNPCLFLLGGSNWLQKELGIRRYVDFSGIECKLNTILTPHLVYINLTIYSAQFVKTFLGNLLSKLFRIYKTLLRKFKGQNLLPLLLLFQRIHRLEMIRNVCEN